MTHTIVGLGNPGEEYQKSRHNAGRIVVDLLRETYSGAEWKNDTKAKALTARADIAGEPALLLCPNTYMNRSGQSAGYFIKSKKAAAQLIVVYDDMDLPVGQVRISYNRGDGGHRGLESIIKSLKTREFVRVRVGVTPTTITGKLKKPKSSDEKGTHTFLLKPLSGKQQRAFEEGLKTAATAIEKIISSGHVAAMNEFN